MVSIITPMYNSGRYIAETIESVLAQTYTDWELIVINDHSTDDGPKIVMDYVRKDYRIHMYHQDYDHGAAHARNAGLRRAKGKYVAFLDSDDRWLPNKLEKQLSFMRLTGAHFSHTACAVIDENGERTGRKRYVPWTMDYDDLLHRNPISCLTVIVDREYFPGVRMPAVPHEDYVTWLELMRDGEIAFGLNEILAEYRVAKRSLSGNKLKAAYWRWNVYRNYLKLPLFDCIKYFRSYVNDALDKWY